jgi:tRNA(Ile)-lysidine synthase
MSTVFAKVAAALNGFFISDRERRIGVAVSGGPDSVALLSALVELSPRQRLQLTVLHVNHALRPEAEQEQQFVESLCQRWCLPCLVDKLHPRWKESGIEAWARKERYRFFQQTKEQHGLDAVALAHTRDDQAETVLFRLLRGTGRRGLAGIPPQRDGWLIRPLLECSRQEVMAYLTAKRLLYVTDSSNTDLRYTRNKIRHVLLPLLEREFSPKIRPHLAQLAESLRQEEAWLDAQAQAAYERVQDGSLHIVLDRLRKEPVALHARLFRLWLAQAGQAKEMGFRHLQQIAALSTGRISGEVAVPGGWLVRREGNMLSLASHQTASICTSYQYALMPGDSLVIPEAGWEVSMSLPYRWGSSLTEARQPDLWQAVFDADVLTTPLIVRNVQPGDRVHPFGMEGHKKIHDIFIDKKIARKRRRCWPLVESHLEVMWIPGLVRGAGATITAATQRAVRLMVNPLPENQKLC